MSSARYRDALEWVDERLSVDGGMTEAEQELTRSEIRNVLCGRPTENIAAWKRRREKLSGQGEKV